ncbi:hypothetical protein [Acinetobacter phage vB_AbaM_BP10]|jgi:hypothetical protein|nr:hypothetical protein [Acinetobacter phage vB_AbaM_BP10]
MELNEFKQKLIDMLSDEFSFAHHHGDETVMHLIEEVFKRMDLETDSLDYIKQK